MTQAWAGVVRMGGFGVSPQVSQALEEKEKTFLCLDTPYTIEHLLCAPSGAECLESGRQDRLPGGRHSGVRGGRGAEGHQASGASW